MIIYVSIYDLAKNESVYDGSVITEVTNSFVPANLFLSGANDENETVLIKAQQVLSLKFTYKYNSKDLMFFTDGYVVLDEYGFLNYLIHNNTCFLNNSENGNYAVETFEPAMGIRKFIPLDYSDDLDIDV